MKQLFKNDCQFNLNIRQCWTSNCTFCAAIFANVSFSNVMTSCCRNPRYPLEYFVSCPKPPLFWFLLSRFNVLIEITYQLRNDNPTLCMAWLTASQCIYQVYLLEPFLFLAIALTHDNQKIQATKRCCNNVRGFLVCFQTCIWERLLDLFCIRYKTLLH